jgi:hypothetical protein
MPAFSLFAILGVASLRLRLRNRCGLGLNRNPPFLDGHYPDIMKFVTVFKIYLIEPQWKDQALDIAC